jgi:predicted signal transduction protein with EAL and GGDEF domain
LARFGGDEFTVLLEDVVDVADAEAAAVRMLEVLRDPIPIGNGKEVVVTISIGISVATGAATADDLLHNADVAMYQAKTRGVGTYKVFDVQAMGARSVERLDLEACLRRALDNEDEIDVYYQPVVSSETGDIVGAEALVRWHHPTRGFLAPGHFIPLAEETGLILPLGRLVLNRACRVASSISDELGFPLSMSVNLSGRQFVHPNVVAEVADAILRSGIAPSQLCMEITESVAVEDLQRSDGILNELKAIGVRLAIDDFGTGYSSLKYLKRFPVDIVKIDRSFVMGVDVNPVDAAIVNAILGLATAVGMTTIAEGVETVGQLRRLREMGCPLVQGFYIGLPMPADAFVDAVLATMGPQAAPDLVRRAG